MVRRRKLWLVLTLVLGLAVGGAAGYFAQSRIRATRKTTARARPGSTAPSTAPAKKAAPLPADPERIRQTMSFLSSNIGPRPAGKPGEKQAGSYLLTELEKIGYKVGMEQFPVPNGMTSQNLITASPGKTSLYTFFVCAHMDTRPGSSGANDNASGCAALLELARTVKDIEHYPEIRFLVFGAGEENSSGSARVGSTYYLGTQPQHERNKIIGVLCLDTVAVGPEICFRDWGPSSPALADILAAYARARGLQATRMRGEGSDHQPFGDAGIPAAWMERMMPGNQRDPRAGLSGDAMDHVFVDLAVEVVNTTRDYLLGLDRTACETMHTTAYGHAPAGTAPSRGRE